MKEEGTVEEREGSESLAVNLRQAAPRPAGTPHSRRFSSAIKISTISPFPENLWVVSALLAPRAPSLPAAPQLSRPLFSFLSSPRLPGRMTGVQEEGRKE